MDYAINFWVYWEALQASVAAIPRVSPYAAAKYQWLLRFAIGPHSIYIQERKDPDRQWLPLDYKVTMKELDAIVQDWPMEWCNPVSQEELSKEMPHDAPEEPTKKELSIHDSDNESLTNSEAEAQHMREEI